MAFMSTAHVHSPYFGRLIDGNEAKARKLLPLARFDLADIQAKTRIRGALWFVSNCRNKERLRVAKEMSR